MIGPGCVIMTLRNDIDYRNDPDWITYQQAADHFQVKVDFIRRIPYEQLRRVKLGHRTVRIHKQDLKIYIDQRRRETNCGRQTVAP